MTDLLMLLLSPSTQFSPTMQPAATVVLLPSVVEAGQQKEQMLKEKYQICCLIIHEKLNERTVHDVIVLGCF